MPTKVDESSLHRVVLGLERALKKINAGDGYNTTPRVGIGAKQLRETPISDLPMVRIELGDLSPSTEFYGGPEEGVIRWAWDAYVWGFVGHKGKKRDLYRAGNALFVDVLAAIYSDETLADGAGQGTALFVNPSGVAFDMESFSNDKKGYFMAKFELVVDLIRGDEP